MEENRAILEYRRTLRLRVAEYEREMLIAIALRVRSQTVDWSKPGCVWKLRSPDCNASWG